MGKLLNNLIEQIRSWKTVEEETAIPISDYNNIYPKTVYDAVRRDFDETSVNLTDELASIYNLIADKQTKISAGIPGRLMSWTGQEGYIGEVEVIKSINSDSDLWSQYKIPTEKAVGLFGNTKVNYEEFENHITNSDTHITSQEREKWNKIDNLEGLGEHSADKTIHITSEERELWNSKASQDDLEDHLADLNNPHNVTAHQAGTYNRNEIDDMFTNIRSSFFNYKSISYDERYNTATLVDYDADLWNPNYILTYGDELPEVPDISQIYFALKPNTDYATNETQDCQIYIKKPGNTWQLIGLQSMAIGDLVIRYPDTTMCVWISGKFKSIFADSGISDGSSSSTPSSSTFVFRPVWTSGTELGWELTTDTTPPAPVNLQGPDGYTPIKGVDYTDGDPGIGVPTGGNTGDVLIKTDGFDYETAWKSFDTIIQEWLANGGQLPSITIDYSEVENAPILYQDFGENTDGMISQKIITDKISDIDEKINSFEILASRVELTADNAAQEISDHEADFENPHRVTAAQIGAVSNDSYLDHVQNFENPHIVTAQQIGLGNVDNTSDLDKPISTLTQEALNNINSRLSEIVTDIGTNNFISNAIWNASTCSLTLHYRDGSSLLVQIPIVETLETLTYDSENKELVITMPDGTETRMNIQNLVSEYTGRNSRNIAVRVNEDGTITAEILAGSITENELKASLNLPGEPTANTPVETDRSNRLATTEFVKTNILDNLISFQTDRALSANMGRELNNRKADRDEIIQLIMDLNSYEVIDNLESISPLNPLSANMGRYLNENKADKYHAHSSGSIYGRASIDLFGHARASNIDPLMDGIIFIGTDDGYYARSDHRHPTDISRAPIHFPDIARNQRAFTGEPRSSMPPDDDNSDWIATTAWIRRNSTGLVYGHCNTQSSVFEKKVILNSSYTNKVYFNKQIGASICIKFKYDNDGPIALNINDTIVENVLFGNKDLTKGMIRADHSYIFVYDGENWILQNPSGVNKEDLPDGVTDNHFASTEWVRNNDKGPFLGWTTTLGSRNIKYAYLSSDIMQKYGLHFKLQRGTTVAVNFENSDKSEDITKLNIENTGDYPIIYAKENIDKKLLHKNHNHIFTFDGNNWILQNPYIEDLDPNPNIEEVEIDNGLPHLEDSIGMIESRPNNLNIGDIVQYKFIITNNGDGPARDVWVSQFLTGLKLNSVLRLNDNMILMLNRETNQFPLGDIQVNETITLLVECEVTSLPTIGNITVIHTVEDVPDVIIIIADDPNANLTKSTKVLSEDSILTEYHENDIITYDLIINNIGAETAENIYITENPRSLNILNFTRVDGTEITPESENIYRLGNIDPVSSQIYHVKCKITNAENFKNFIMIYGDNIDPIKIPSNGFADLTTSTKELVDNNLIYTNPNIGNESDIFININEDGELTISTTNTDLSFALENNELIITSIDDTLHFELDENDNLIYTNPNIGNQSDLFININDSGELIISTTNNDLSFLLENDQLIINSNDDSLHFELDMDNNLIYTNPNIGINNINKIIRYKLKLRNTGDVDASHLQIVEKPNNLTIFTMLDESGNIIEPIEDIERILDLFVNINDNGELVISTNNDDLSFLLENDELTVKTTDDSLHFELDMDNNLIYTKYKVIDYSLINTDTLTFNLESLRANSNATYTVFAQANNENAYNECIVSSYDIEKSLVIREED